MAYGFNDDKSKATIKTQNVQYDFYPVENIPNGSYGRLAGTRLTSKNQVVVSINGVDFWAYGASIEDPNITSMERIEEGGQTIQKVNVRAKNATGATITPSTRYVAGVNQTVI